MNEDETQQDQAGNTQQPSDGQGNPNGYMTKQELNAMLSNYMKRQLAQFEKMFSTFAAPLQELMTRQQAAPQQQQQNETEVTAQLTNLQKRLEASEKAYADEKKKREDGEAARMRDEEKSELMRHARRIGVASDTLARAFALTHSGNVGRDENGQIVYYMERNGFKEPRQLNDAIDEIAKTAEGKEFIAPRGTSGSGASKATMGTSNNGVLKNGKMTQEAANQTLGAILGGFADTE
jgi:hypothetical protein